MTERARAPDAGDGSGRRGGGGRLLRRALRGAGGGAGVVAASFASAALIACGGATLSAGLRIRAEWASGADATLLVVPDPLAAATTPAGAAPADAPGRTRIAAVAAVAGAPTFTIPPRDVLSMLNAWTGPDVTGTIDPALLPGLISLGARTPPPDLARATDAVAPGTLVAAGRSVAGETLLRAGDRLAAAGVAVLALATAASLLTLLLAVARATRRRGRNAIGVLVGLGVDDRTIAARVCANAALASFVGAALFAAAGALTLAVLPGAASVLPVPLAAAAIAAVPLLACAIGAAVARAEARRHP